MKLSRKQKVFIAIGIALIIISPLILVARLLPGIQTSLCHFLSADIYTCGNAIGYLFGSVIFFYLFSFIPALLGIMFILLGVMRKK